MGKNKKSKGKGKAPGANNNGPPIFEDNNVSTIAQNQPRQNSGDTESQYTGVSESDLDLDKPAVDDGKQNIIPELEGKESLPNSKSELEAKVKSLQEDVYQCLKKEVGLDMRLEQLQSEINSWILKELNLNERIKALEDDKNTWTLKQSSSEEMMYKLAGTNAALQTKVTELGDSSGQLSQENQQLLSNISLLELRVQNLEETVVMGLLANRSTEISPEHAIKRAESSPELVIRSVEDSQEVNMPYEEQNQHTSSENNLVVEFESSKGTAEGAASSDHVSALHSSSNVLETISFDGSLNEASAVVMPASADRRGSHEILPLQLDEIEIQEVDLQSAVDSEKEEAVPLTDAPLIGAPFRLISFMAKYVSGADLVKEKART